MSIIWIACRQLACRGKTSAY